jgi:23S rRNA (guanosine2251-2'-O)-methyltransferase
MIPADRTEPGEPFRIRQCRSKSCGFRFPVDQSVDNSNLCPLCHEEAPFVSQSFSGRGITPTLGDSAGPPVEVLLDNMRSSYNVGSTFRTCDGAGVSHVHLCGITATPNQAKVSKTALGADKSMTWTYHRNGLEAVRRLRAEGREIWSLENRIPSLSIFAHAPMRLSGPIVLVIGNELSGVDPGILNESDKIVSIPMVGHKSSLNAVVACGVAVYWLRFGALVRSLPLSDPS